MRKVLAVVLWAGIPFCWQPLWGQAPGVGVKAGSQQKQQPKLAATQPKEEQRGTKDSPLVIETHARPDSPEEATKRQAENDTKEYRDRWTFRLTVAGVVFTGLLVILTGGLVIVGWRGVNAAVRTLGAIERQATLMQASMTQWVSVANWKASIIQLVGPLSQQPKRLSIEFDVLNESSFPLTMRATFRFFGNLPNRARLDTVGDVILFPRKPYTSSIGLYVTEAQAQEYFEHSLRIAVHGEIVHTGVAGESSPLMEIRGNLVCGMTVPTRLEFETIRMIQIDQGERQTDGQNPN